jgi:hypothetical protein
MLRQVRERRGLHGLPVQDVWPSLWEFLFNLVRHTPPDDPCTPVLAQVVRGLSGAEEALSELAIWKTNYHRLANAFPIRQVMYLRRWLLATPGPSTTDGLP